MHKRMYATWLSRAKHLCAALVFGVSLLGAQAAAIVRTEQATVELVVYAPQGLSPGVKAWAGIIIEHQPQWHTYWKNPGDSGLPTEMQWQLPEGMSAGAVLWPLPKKIPIAPLANYGFEGRTLLAVPLSIASNFKPNFLTGKVRIGLQATWLICRRECIPQSGEFQIEVPAGASTVSDGELFEKLIQVQPKRITGKQVAHVFQEQQTQSGKPSAQFLRVDIEGLPAAWRGKHLEAFPETAGLFETAKTAQSAPQKWEGGKWTVDLAISPYRQSAPKQLPITIIHRASERGVVAEATISEGWKAKTIAPAAQDASKTGAAGLEAGGVGEKTDAQSHSETGDGKTPGLDSKAEPSYEASLPEQGIEQTMPVPASTPIDAEKAGQTIKVLGSSTLLWSLLAALLGGLLLNLMPCVFPVLAIKVLSFANGGAAGERQAQTASLLKGALLYAAGVVLSFVSLAALLLLLRSAGEALGWGFQLQSPWVVAGLMLFFMAMAFNLLGFFELRSILPSGVANWRSDNPRIDQFLSGILAVLIASPCTAPFMGAALGAALTYPAWAGLAVFAVLGLGMALPYVLLATFPKWLALLPRPGVWMQRVKQWMALPLLLTVAWLAWVLYQQLVPPRAPLQMEASTQVAGQWQAWSPETEKAVLAQNVPVFVDYTAAWCITCQVNKRTTLYTTEVEMAFKAKNVQLLRADWTRYDPAITESLRKLGRTGIPVYVLYAPNRPPQLFTELLSKEALLEALQAL